MTVNSDIEYAEELIIEAHNRLNPYTNASFPDQHRMSHMIQDTQECIELYTKSMFKLMGVRFPESHDLRFSQDEVQNFINCAYSELEDFEFLDRLPRIIFLTAFWETYYNTGKYGDQNLNIRPGDVIEVSDLELALEHAKFCRETAVALFEHISDENVQDTPEESS